MDICELESNNDSKRPYNSPRLLRYGTFLDITEGGGGFQREPGGTGAPKSRNVGTVA